MQRSLAIAGTACLSGILIGRRTFRRAKDEDSTFAREMMPVTVQQSIYKLGLFASPSVEILPVFRGPESISNTASDFPRQLRAFLRRTNAQPKVGL